MNDSVVVVFLCARTHPKKLQTILTNLAKMEANEPTVSQSYNARHRRRSSPYLINIQEKAIRNAGLVMSNNRETANKEKNPNKTKIGKEDVTWFIPPNTKKGQQQSRRQVKNSCIICIIIRGEVPFVHTLIKIKDIKGQKEKNESNKLEITKKKKQK